VPKVIRPNAQQLTLPRTERMSSWGKLSDRAGIGDLTFHDLRGTAVVRLAIAGATVPQIATFTGHSLKDVEAILDGHYLGRDIQLAEAAVLKLEARTKL
jgi:integrase